jgi:Response regulator containing CheY-like receiver, AAA-type ATPase, and DNA-binding domains
VTATDLLESFPQPFILIDQNYRIVAANRRYAERYGLGNASEVVGRRCHEVSHHSDKPCFMNGEQCPHREIFTTGKACEVTHRHFDRSGGSEYVTIRGTPVHDEQGQLRWMGEGLCHHASGADLRFDDVEMVGHSAPFTGTLKLLSLVAESDLPVLITGETGSGKELAARYLHRQSPRSAGNFVPVDGNVLSDELFASELFGHEKGSFTGAVGAKAGLFEQADKGTLFLDEIGDISLALQTKLLRVLETGTYRRVGGTELRRACVRLLCATNRNLKQMVADGRFRADLYYRIARVHVELPPLRERRADIPEIAAKTLSRQATYRSVLNPITPEAMQKLSEYAWPGNVRELVNAIERAAVLAGGDRIEPQHLPDEVREPHREMIPSARGQSDARNGNLSRNERPAQDDMDSALQRFGGNRRQAADWLGISERTLYRYLSRHRNLVAALLVGLLAALTDTLLNVLASGLALIV